LRFRKTCYRLHDPRWAFGPASGAGAAIHGGRFNPKGVPALYLGLTIESAFGEITQGLAEKFKPCVIVCYDADCEDIADLRTEAGRAEQDVSLDEMACGWFSLIAEGREPPSWAMSRRLMRRGVAGIVVPSFAAAADPERHQNLVLWKWGPELPHQIVAYDPEGRLAAIGTMTGST
jgi:RES domain-containing protein